MGDLKDKKKAPPRWGEALSVCLGMMFRKLSYDNLSAVDDIYALAYVVHHVLAFAAERAEYLHAVGREYGHLLCLRHVQHYCSVLTCGVEAVGCVRAVYVVGDGPSVFYAERYAVEHSVARFRQVEIVHVV